MCWVLESHSTPDLARALAFTRTAAFSARSPTLSLRPMVLHPCDCCCDTPVRPGGIGMRIFIEMFCAFLRVVRLIPCRRRSSSLAWMLQTVLPNSIKEVRVLSLRSSVAVRSLGRLRSDPVTLTPTPSLLAIIEYQVPLAVGLPQFQSRTRVRVGLLWLGGT